MRWKSPLELQGQTISSAQDFYWGNLFHDLSFVMGAEVVVIDLMSPPVGEPVVLSYQCW